MRALIDDGAALIPKEKLALCVVTAEVADGAVDGAVGAAVASRCPAAACTRCRSATPGRRGRPPRRCAATHVTYLGAPVRRVLSLVPEMYDEIWTAANGFYKLEPVVADGGEVGNEHLRGRLPRGEPRLLDPASVDPDAFAAEPDTLVVPRAGEMLFRLR